jgi:hypothetical protein
LPEGKISLRVVFHPQGAARLPRVLFRIELLDIEAGVLAPWRETMAREGSMTMAERRQWESIKKAEPGNSSIE